MFYPIQLKYYIKIWQPPYFPDSNKKMGRQHWSVVPTFYFSGHPLPDVQGAVITTVRHILFSLPATVQCFSRDKCASAFLILR